jgi:FAD/FMN-containing dehydrogenase
MMAEHGLEQVDVAQSDRQLWERQRAGQRSSERAIVRVATNPSSLPEVLSAVDRSDATLVGRAALGAHYVELDPDAVTRFRADLPDSVVTIVLDAPAQLRGQRDVWGPENDAMTLMRSIKDRFDPDGTCNPGLFVGGI